MSFDSNTGTGIERLIQKYRDQFRIPENIENYSREDYSRAEKYYVTYCLKNGHPFCGE
jgi:hypothetical protein